MNDQVIRLKTLELKADDFTSQDELEADKEKIEHTEQQYLNTVIDPALPVVRDLLKQAEKDKPKTPAPDPNNTSQTCMAKLEFPTFSGEIQNKPVKTFVGFNFSMSAITRAINCYMIMLLRTDLRGIDWLLRCQGVTGSE